MNTSVNNNNIESRNQVITDEIGRDPKVVAFCDKLAIFEGDRVLSRHYGAVATVLSKKWDSNHKAWYYRVQFDEMQRHMDGSEFNVTEFLRYGITKNFNDKSEEIKCNALNYAEQLLADYWSCEGQPLELHFEFTNGTTVVQVYKPVNIWDRWRTVITVGNSKPVTTMRTLYDVSHHLQTLHECSIQPEKAA